MPSPNSPRRNRADRPVHRRPRRPADDDRSEHLDDSGESLATILHAAVAGGATPLLVAVAADEADEHLSVGTWPIPREAQDPLAHLVGWLCPQRCIAVGLTAPGLATSGADATAAGAPGAPAAQSRLCFTALVGRDGSTAYVTDIEGSSPRTGTDMAGPVVDALHRTLGLPTAPPARGTAAWTETRWLDAVAQVALTRPGTATWAEVARLHPLSGGRVLEAETLALATLTADQRTSWTDLRHRLADDITTGRRPPEGTTIRASSWFDDGSFARWVQRELPDFDDLADAVLSTLPDDVAATVARALTTGTTGPGTWRR